MALCITLRGIKVENVQKELDFLKKENSYLKQLLLNMMHQREQSTKILPKEDILTNRSPVDAKIILFRSLFKVRTDVYALRFILKDGKPGYAPAR